MILKLFMTCIAFLYKGLCDSDADLLVLISQAWIVQDPIRSEVTQEAAQIVLLVWMVGKHPMFY